MPMMTLGDPNRVVNYTLCGPADAAAIVLLHAVGLDLTWWDQQISVLSKDYRVLAFDFPGHGGSSVQMTAYDLDILAQDTSALLRATVGPAHVVGLSVGGMIAQTLALADHDLVRSLTLIDTAAGFTDEIRAVMVQRAEMTRQGGMKAVLEPTIGRWFTPEFIARRPDVIDRAKKILLSNSPIVHAAMWDGISRLDLVDRLSAITCPCLVLVGEKDSTTPVAASQRIAAAIQNSKLQVLPDAAHISTQEVPDIVNSAILEFLAGCANATWSSNGYCNFQMGNR